MTAVELLAAFRGESAEQYQPYFRFSEESRIVAMEIHSVGMENAIATYSAQEGPWHEVNNILRISTADGFEGISGVDTYYQGTFSDAHGVALEAVAADVARLGSLDPVVVSAALEEMHPELGNEVRASIDIALWDLAARKARQPLHELLGASRSSIEAYASLPFYETLPEYIDAVHEYAKHGFKAFKYHVWGSLDEDLRLIERVQEAFADSDYRFMIDLESMYDIDDAMTLGRQMDKGLFVWFEAPVDDTSLEQYAELKSSLSNLIIPAGYNVYSPEFMRAGIAADAWDMGRFDSTVVGGISEALRLLIIANDADLTIDIQSWGHSLAQSANLQLMLANERTRLFEAPMPKAVFEFGMVDGNLIHAGRAVAPDAPGLGISVDWVRLRDADFYVRKTVDLSNDP